MRRRRPGHGDDHRAALLAHGVALCIACALRSRSELDPAIRDLRVATATRARTRSKHLRRMMPATTRTISPPEIANVLPSARCRMPKTRDARDDGRRRTRRRSCMLSPTHVEVVPRVDHQALSTGIWVCGRGYPARISKQPQPRFLRRLPRRRHTRSERVLRVDVDLAIGRVAWPAPSTSPTWRRVALRQRIQPGDGLVEPAARPRSNAVRSGVVTTRSPKTRLRCRAAGLCA